MKLAVVSHSDAGWHPDLREGMVERFRVDKAGRIGYTAWSKLVPYELAVELAEVRKQLASIESQIEAFVEPAPEPERKPAFENVFDFIEQNNVRAFVASTSFPQFASYVVGQLQKKYLLTNEEAVAVWGALARK